MACAGYIPTTTAIVEISVYSGIVALGFALMNAVLEAFGSGTPGEH